MHLITCRSNGKGGKRERARLWSQVRKRGPQPTPRRPGPVPDERRLGLAKGVLAGMSRWGRGVDAIERDRLHAAHAAAVRVQYTCGRRMNTQRRAPVLLRKRIQRKGGKSPSPFPRCIASFSMFFSLSFPEEAESEKNQKTKHGRKVSRSVG